MSSVLERLTSALSDRYRLDRELGQGGMATVYLAHDLKHDRDVAIKVLHPDLGAALGGERFLSEIRTTARLQHPHILALLDSDEADGLLYYVMPLVTGETLRARLDRERQLPIDDALRITREVGDALAYAHRGQVIHRDIKPENILLQDGHALVADFGIALAVQSASGARMTQTGLSLGTPQYMSPEQAMGERTIDARSDLYALAAVAYEMLTGEPPFTGASVQAIVARILTESPRAIAPQRKAVPDAVEAAVLRALEKLPADRFADLPAFLAALDATAPATANRAAVRSSVAPAAARQRATIVVAATLVAFAGTGGWLLGRRGQNADAAATMSLSVMLPDSTVIDPLRPAPEGLAMLALSPDGLQLAVAAHRTGSDLLHIRRLADFAMRSVAGTDGAASPFYSPAGDAIAFFADSALKTVTLLDGRVRSVRTGLVDAFGGAWMPDGRFVLSVGRATRLMIVSSAGDSLEQIPCGSPCSYPAPLSDAHRVVVGGGTSIRIIDLAKGSVTPVVRSGAAGEALRGVMPRPDGRGHLVYLTLAGQLMVAPFDEARGIVTGDAAMIADSVRVESGRGAAQFALSAAGALAFVASPERSRGLLVRADRSGRLDTIPAPSANYLSFAVSPDGRRVASRVRLPNGNFGVHVIDVATGKVTPWIEAPFLDRPDWTTDGQRLLVARDTDIVIGNPDVASPPQRFVLPRRVGFVAPTADSAAFSGFTQDSLLLQFIDGRPTRAIAASSLLNTISPDLKWFVSEDLRDGTSSLIARALDGTGRRLVIHHPGRLGMVSWAAGGNELMAADFGDPASAGPMRQGFWAIPYDPTRAESPFGEPHLLFRARATDFPGRNYDVGLGGRLFIFKQTPDIPPMREVRVIRQWSLLLAAPAPR